MHTIAFLAFLFAATTQPAYEPTANYEVRNVEGWNVYVHKRLLAEKPELATRTLDLLRAKLIEVKLVLPKRAAEKLTGVRIWVEMNSPVVGMCYHPSREWLAGHGYNPEKAGAIEIGNPGNFIAWSNHQPAMVLHELAHAYHHQVIGYDNREIRQAFEHAKEKKLYESVLRYDGRRARAYAMNNDQEYFAEQTEAYFATNDFYPFVRAELKEHDPEMFEVVKKLWTEGR